MLLLDCIRYCSNAAKKKKRKKKKKGKKKWGHSFKMLIILSCCVVKDLDHDVGTNSLLSCLWTWVGLVLNFG